MIAQLSQSGGMPQGRRCAPAQGILNVNGSASD
jgi:hypothetical protein